MLAAMILGWLAWAGSQEGAGAIGTLAMLPPGAIEAAQAEVRPTTAPASTQASDSQTAARAGGEFQRLLRILKGDEVLTPEDAQRYEFWVNLIKDAVIFTIGFVPKVLVAIFFILLFWAIYRGIRRLVLGTLRKANVDSSIRDLLSATLKWGILGFGLVIAFNQIGIQITALLTGVSLVGLAIGFAAQETLANFIAGIVIFWDRPFRVGDWVEIDDQYGQITRVSFRSTRFLSLDGRTLVMPNTSMLNSRLANHSTNPKNRVDISIGISYMSSIDKAREVLLGLVKDDKRVCAEPPPQVVVTNCAASSVDLALWLWIDEEKYEKYLYYEYLEKAKKALDAAGVIIPFPHLQLFLEDTPALRLLAERKTG